jgi:tetratricopeptide (TPR) repeat protein
VRLRWTIQVFVALSFSAALSGSTAKAQSSSDDAVRLKRAQADLHAGRLQQARNNLELVLKHRPNDPQAILLLGMVAADTEDFTTAEAMFASIRSTYPDPPTLDYQLALVQYHEGHIADSQATLMNMVASGAGTADTHNLLGWCWFRSGNLNQAEQELNQAIRLQPSSLTNYLDLARMQLAARQIDPALDSARVAVKLFPTTAEAWLLKGSIETAGQRFADALASYTTAVHFKPHDQEAELALATAQWLAGVTGQARASFQHLIVRYPRNAAIYVTYADFLTSVGPHNAEQTEALMKRASALDPSLAEPHYYLGNLALTNGKLDEAVKQLQTAIQLDPDSSKAHFALSRALRQQGRSEDSARELGIYKELKTAEDGAASSLQ